MLQAAFLRQLDWFVPPEARTDAATLGRARIFAFSHVFGPFLGIPITGFLYFTDLNRGVPFWLIVACICLFWLLPLGLKYTGRLEQLALFSVANLTFVTLYGSFYYGGVSSPFMPWLLTALLLAFFYLGQKPKLIAAVFGLNLGWFFAAYLMAGSFPQHIPLEALSTVGIVSVICATVYMSMMAIYYADVVSVQSGLEREAARHRATSERLRKVMEEAERANQHKSVFLAKMSHQLRTPLNAVIGYSEILLEDAELNQDAEQIADLRRINSAGTHLLSLVTDVLDMSKIEADKKELVIQPFDLTAFIDDIASTSHNLVEHNANEFAVERGPGLGIVTSDATRLRQAVLNLLSNAGKFTKNGRITLHVSREKGDAEDWIRIAVADTGIGIGPENLKKLFQDFNQADASTSSKYGGTGLGLALSQNLCRMMGGDISVRSEPGKGSRFTIHVPAYIEENRAGGARAQAGSKELQSHAA